MDTEAFKDIAPLILIKDGKRVSITCPRCRLISYNPNDISHMYCNNCGIFYPFARTDTKD